MSRKGQTKIRKIELDPIYSSETVSRLINYSMRNGKKTPAAKQVYLALDILKKEAKSDDVLATLEQSLDAIRKKPNPMMFWLLSNNHSMLSNQKSRFDLVVSAVLFTKFPPQSAVIVRCH